MHSIQSHVVRGNVDQYRLLQKWKSALSREKSVEAVQDFLFKLLLLRERLALEEAGVQADEPRSERLLRIEGCLAAPALGGSGEDVLELRC